MYTVKILITPCCTQVTKTKDSYLYQKSCSAERRWRAGNWITARELNVLTTDCAQNDKFSGCTLSQSPAHHLVSALLYFLGYVTCLKHRVIPRSLWKVSIYGMERYKVLFRQYLWCGMIQCSFQISWKPTVLAI